MPSFSHRWKTNDTCPQCQHHHGYNCWLPGILFMLGSILLAGVFIRLRYPLACGPRYG